MPAHEDQVLHQEPIYGGSFEAEPRAFVALTEAGAILVLTNYPEVEDPRLRAMLERRGYAKFIAYSVPLEPVRRSYGRSFDLVAADLGRRAGARVLDYNGARVFRNFSLSEMVQTVWHEA